LLLGGIAGCNDHNPNVVFVTDAGIDGKTEAGAPQDGADSHDGNVTADAAIATEVAGQGPDVALAPDLVPDVNPAIDTTPGVDGSAERAVDVNLVIDSPAPIDGSRLAIDGTGGSAVEAGIDSSASADGGGVGG
jgi:hypothetical protein